MQIFGIIFIMSLGIAIGIILMIGIVDLIYNVTKRYSNDKKYTWGKDGTEWYREEYEEDNGIE